MSKKNLVMLAILDGYGINNNPNGNAISAAKKPNLDYIFSPLCRFTDSVFKRKGF